MKGVKRKQKYTVLVVPEGTGTTKTFDLTGDYWWRIGSMTIIILGTLFASFGIQYYEQLQVIKYYEEQISHKEKELLSLVEGNEVLAMSIGQLESALERTKGELRQFRPQRIVENAPIASAPIPVVAPEPIEPIEQDGRGGTDEEDLLAYIPSFTPCEGQITSPFGSRTNPFTKKSTQMHNGIDVANSMGTPIYAAASGVVEVARYLNGYGYAIYIDHGNGIQTRYAHNSKLLVKEGQEVKKGDEIAKMGSTGNSTGSHLHFEILEKGNQVNPEHLFK